MHICERSVRLRANSPLAFNSSQDCALGPHTRPFTPAGEEQEWSLISQVCYCPKAGLNSLRRYASVAKIGDIHA